jgi:hypothetical protein
VADDNDIASDTELNDREAALAAHRQRMASIKPANDCRYCDEPLIDVRKPWGCCIECATKAEQLGRHFR